MIMKTFKSKVFTLHLTDLIIFLTFASQKAPLYFALTSVPMGRYGGSEDD